MHTVPRRHMVGCEGSRTHRTRRRPHGGYGSPVEHLRSHRWPIVLPAWRCCIVGAAVERQALPRGVRAARGGRPLPIRRRVGRTQNPCRRPRGRPRRCRRKPAALRRDLLGRVGAVVSELVTVTIDGRETKAEKGRILIDVAEEMNIFVPRFCYHPGMKSVAVCRMCLVEIEGMPKLAPACATPVADGMKVSTYRFVSRPWDLKTAPSVCNYCSVGCPISNEARADKLVRVQALPNEHVNDFWVCDKGRFAFHYVDSEDRLTTPLVRSGDEFESTSWGVALKRAAEKLDGAERIGVLAGGHLTTEDAFAVARVAKKVLKTPHVDSRIQDAGAPYELAVQLSGAAGSNATLDDLESAGTIVWAGSDPKETLPVLYLRLRKAVLDNEAKLIVVSPRRTSLDAFASHVIRSDAGGAAGELKRLVDGDCAAATDIGDPLVVCWEHSAPGRDEAAVFATSIELARARGGELLVCPPHAGSQGLIDMGVYPVLDAGYKPAANSGMDTRAVLEAAGAGELVALVLVGADPITDFPDASLARSALEKVPFTLAVELFATESVQLADVVLPSAANPERDGTYTNLERRLQKLEPLVPAPGSAREPWRALAALAGALGQEFGWSSIDDVWNDIRKEVPTPSAIELERLTQSVPPTALQYESGFEADYVAAAVVAGPGGGYPKGWRSGAPFQTGQNWPLSWELRAFEAKQRPGVIPDAPGSTEESEASHPRGSEASARDGRFDFLTGRLIYDEGSMVRRTSVLRALAKRPYVEMNDEDVKALGLADGDEVVVAANGTEQRCRLVVADIARGAVFVPYDQAGLPANSLIGSVN